MPKKCFSAEQIVILLRQIEALISQGKGAPMACREADRSPSQGPSSAGLGPDQARHIPCASYAVVSLTLVQNIRQANAAQGLDGVRCVNAG